MVPAEVQSRPRPTLYEMIEQEGFLSLDSMEGGLEVTQAPSLGGKRWQVLPGILLAIGLTAVATFLHQLPFPPFTLAGASLEHPLGVSILAILLGLIAGSWIKLSARMKRGCQWAAYWFIPVAIVCLGAGVDAGFLGQVAGHLVLATGAVMLVAMVLGVFVGRLCGLDKRTSYLLGVGTAVCGSSAVLAVAPATEAPDDEVLVAVGVVNLVGLLAMFACVALLWFSPMGEAHYGAWVGATIHAVPQVVAAGESYGAGAATMATMVKLVRVSMLAPVILFSVLLFRGRRLRSSQSKTGGKFWLGVVPWFIWGFILFAVLRIFGCLPLLSFDGGGWSVESSDVLQAASKWLLAVAMAAIGLQVNVRTMLKSGARALLAGVLVWLLLAVFAFGVFAWLL